MKRNIERVLFVVVLTALIVLGITKYNLEKKNSETPQETATTTLDAQQQATSSSATSSKQQEEDLVDTKQQEQESEGSTVTIGGTTFEVEIADEPVERARGLSDHEMLEDKHGMLFVFDTMGNYPFWMKGMDFSIDMIWINDVGRIVYIAEDVPPESYPAPYNPGADALYVLELSAKSVSEYDISVGDTVDINI